MDLSVTNIMQSNGLRPNVPTINIKFCSVKALYRHSGIDDSQVVFDITESPNTVAKPGCQILY